MYLSLVSPSFYISLSPICARLAVILSVSDGVIICERIPYINTHDHHHIPPAFACTCSGRKRPLFSFPHPLGQDAVCCVSYPFLTGEFALSLSYYPILGTLARLSLGDLRVSSHFSPLTDLIAPTLSRGMSHSSCDVPSWHTSPDRYRFLQHIQLYWRHLIRNDTAYHLR